MVLLAIPMYAAPFVLLSLMSFAVFMAVPKIRRFAAAALVAPVAFGYFAIVELIGWVLVGEFFLRIEPGPMKGLRSTFAFILFFVAPGMLGSWAAVWIANKSVRMWRKLPIAPSWRERTAAAEAAHSKVL